MPLSMHFSFVPTCRIYHGQIVQLGYAPTVVHGCAQLLTNGGIFINSCETAVFLFTLANANLDVWGDAFNAIKHGRFYISFSIIFLHSTVDYPL